MLKNRTNKKINETIAIEDVIEFFGKQIFVVFGEKLKMELKKSAE